MISGAHVIVCTKDPEADRAFFRDVLGFHSVDAGHGWLIFALPPSEPTFHPSEKNGPHKLFFLCDNLKSEMAVLAIRESLARRFTKKDGVRLQGCCCPAAAKSASINQSIRPP
jgi:catechol 2,3-dioxygenase-like lactoylglutathione lyase family enzyme